MARMGANEAVDHYGRVEVDSDGASCNNMR